MEVEGVVSRRALCVGEVFVKECLVWLNTRGAERQSKKQ